MYNVKYIYFVFLFFLTACSTTSDPQLYGTGIDTKGEIIFGQKAQQYPYLDVRLAKFCADDKDAKSVTNPTPEQKISMRTFNVQEKRTFMRKLDFIRFVVHMPEFEEEALTRTFYLAREGTGPLGSNKIDDKADVRRVINLLKQFSYDLTIVKKANLNPWASAVAAVGPFSYNHPSPLGAGSFIGYPSTRDFSNPEGKENASDIGILFHEIMHNLGFTHGAISGTDVVYGMNFLMEDIAGQLLKEGHPLNIKYKAQLDKLRPFYEYKYKSMLMKDTYIRDPGLNTTASFLTKDGDVCILYEDGTYSITKL